ncbi:MAG: nitroreductase family protein [Sphingobacteriaceae bacterium]|nr:nitroreductase family protein [Sphingobacteriaceae bacterium]
MEQHPFIPYSKTTYATEEMLLRSKNHFEYYDKRRTVREFSDKAIPDEVLENIILSASTAPSGAHKQPWTFCVVTNREIKKQIREAAEKEEFDSYNGRMPDDWLEDLAPLGTDWKKPFLETAPALIIIFKRSYEFVNDKKKNNYYVSESVGIACGYLLEAIHYCGLVALTHTPSPMNFLSKVLNRPENEKPYLLVPIGYPLETTMVPDIKRKPIEDIAIWYK